jgi:hypothetical protein
VPFSGEKIGLDSVRVFFYCSSSGGEKKAWNKNGIKVEKSLFVFSKRCSVIRPRHEKVDREQGDQIGRYFAYWVIVFFG